MLNQELFDYLRNINCCEICCLRYLKARGSEYEDRRATFKNLGIEVDTKAEDDSPPVMKKIKPNVCPACLGLFSEDFLDNLVEQISSHPDIHNFQCDKIVMAISLPMLLFVKQLSIWLSLIEKFGNQISLEKTPDVPIKETAKLIINPKVCKFLNKSYDANGGTGIMINLYLNHPNEISEIEKISYLMTDLRIDKDSIRKKKIEATRGLLEKHFNPNKITSEDFSKYFTLPPESPLEKICLEKVSFNGPTVFLAGRYRKLCRNLSHSPWVLDGKRVLEDSIQEIIIHSVSNYFGVPADGIIFSSSGREDVDVRCLGLGRPFVLEIPNSKKTLLSPEMAASMEIEIENSGKLSVINLQMVRREDLVHIKTGEESKKKMYRALCILNEPATVDILVKLNTENVFVTNQITPIRVLHRRPLRNRPRNVYSVKATVDRKNNKLLILDIVTQAGCYVKELVHGEFGRTDPSLSSIINKPLDIIALDVNGIELDWPEPIDNRKFLK